MENKPEARKGRSAADFLPEKLTLPTLKEAAADCRGCDLYKNATQTVFGEGPRKAAVMLVGEVPGDQEDRPSAQEPDSGRAGGPQGDSVDHYLAQLGQDRGGVVLLADRATAGNEEHVGGAALDGAAHQLAPIGENGADVYLPAVAPHRHRGG